ncbi:MAG: Ig domain-containing protein [Erysipelotrichaceae bacterium]|nr:Ig domain-containing protein [Erysipelotrichaceae bacterium]
MKKLFTITALFLTALLASCGAKNVDPSSTSSNTSSTSSQTTSSQTTSSKTSSSSQSSVVHVTGISFLSQTATVTEGNSRTIYASISPYNATNDNITWTSSDESVATVTKGVNSLLYYEGVVNAIKPGKATIKATTEDGGFTASCVVTVTEIVHVKGVSLNYDSLKIEKGSQKQLIEHLDPTWPDNDNVSWSSSDESVAIVSDSGLVTAVSEGEATIKATTEDGGFTAECKVTVLPTVVATYTLGETRLNVLTGSYSKRYRISTPLTNTGNVNLYISDFSYDVETKGGDPVDEISSFSVDTHPSIVEPGETVTVSAFYTYSKSYAANELVAKPHVTVKNAMEYDSRRLTVSNVSVSTDSIWGPKVIGKVKNTLDEEVSEYYVTFNMFDQNDNFLLHGYTIISDDLAVDGEKVFSITSLNGSYAKDIDIDSCKIEVVAYEYQFVIIL